MAKRQTPQRFKRLKQPDARTIIQPKWRLIWLFGLLALWLICSGSTPFHPLGNRLEQYPYWNTKPPVESASGDLVYPDWFAGDWRVMTTLVDMTAPFAPDIVTPGFDSNREYVDQPITFQARFVQQPASSGSSPRWLSWRRSPLSLTQTGTAVVADRAFNGLNLARAYLNQASAGLGDRLVLNVKVDPDNPNRQITLMRDDRQLVSTVTGRLTESDHSNQFITTEVFQQVFRGIPQPYLNVVETTTDYHYMPNDLVPITADQITAIYLSPNDSDYFRTGDRPVALYRYRLEFSPKN